MFPDRPYVSLEPLDQREFARRDPRAFLQTVRDGAVLDEIQRVPELLSYIQAEVDEGPHAGRFILTGSQNLLLLEAVTQTLAGRAAMLELLPLSYEELLSGGTASDDPFGTIVAGGYPRIHDRGLEPSAWLADYVAAYVERDVRQVLNVGDLLAFQTFLRLAAGRTGQLLSLANLGADAGVSQPTARQWLSVLEATYVAWRLPPLHGSFRKRLVKTPKICFHDSGLLCHLVGIRTAQELAVHPLRGAIFENWVISEVVKWHRHRGLVPRMAFYRDRAGLEVDLVVEAGSVMRAVEIKSGATIAGDFFDGLEAFGRLRPESEPILIHGGSARQKRSAGLALPWKEVHTIEWA
jgi:predicted AAA+ superfamily ATPase